MGQVVEYYQNSQLQYVPLLQFEYEGDLLKRKLDRGFKRKLAEEGQYLEIYYMPDCSDYVKLARDRRDIWYSIVLLVLGIISIIFLTI